MNTDTYKTALQAEEKKLMDELATVGKKDVTKDEWEAVEPDDNRDRADETEVADGIEKLENNTAILDQLQTRLSEVQGGLARIEEGTYGVCTVCGKPIEADRLDANPAAQTCKTHMA